MEHVEINYEFPIAIEGRAVQDQSVDGPIVFIISDESIDSHDTRFMIDGWDLSYAKRNPVVTYGHPSLDSTDDTLYIGRHELFVEGKKLKARVEFNKDNPRAARIEKAVRNGFLHMASIRAVVRDFDEVKVGDRYILEFRDQQLFDFGIVPHGSNKNAFVEKRDAMKRSLQKPIPEEKEEINVDELIPQIARCKKLIHNIKR